MKPAPATAWILKSSRPGSACSIASASPACARRASSSIASGFRTSFYRHSLVRLLAVELMRERYAANAVRRGTGMSLARFAVRSHTLVIHVCFCPDFLGPLAGHFTSPGDVRVGEEDVGR